MSDSLETLFGKVPEDWSIKLVGKVFSLSQGLQISSKKRIQEKKDGYVPLLKITDLPHKNFSEFVTDIESQYIASLDDIIYTRTGNVGLVYTDVEGCVHNNCFKVHFDKKLFDKYYVYYYLKSKEVFTYSNQVASGSVQKDLTHPAFKSCPIGYPNDLKEQYKIGRILKDIDDKIELNNQINETLEDMATALFKEWFENFNFPNDEGKAYKENGGEMKPSELGEIPIDWELKYLKEISKIVMGQSPKGKSYNEEKLGFPLINGASDFEGTLPKPKKYTTEPTKLSEQNDIVFGIRATIGNVVFINKGYCLGRGVAAVRADDQLLEFLFLLLKKEIDSLANVATGSVFANLTRNDLEKLILLFPPVKILKSFSELIKPIFEKIDLNQQENQILKKQRDTLLPKLMSGKIRV